MIELVVSEGLEPESKSSGYYDREFILKRNFSDIKRALRLIALLQSFSHCNA